MTKIDHPFKLYVCDEIKFITRTATIIDVTLHAYATEWDRFLKYTRIDPYNDIDFIYARDISSSRRFARDRLFTDVRFMIKEPRNGIHILVFECKESYSKGEKPYDKFLPKVKLDIPMWK